MSVWHYSQKFLDFAYITFLRLFVGSPFEPLINRDPDSIQKSLTQYFTEMHNEAFSRINGIIKLSLQANELNRETLTPAKIKEMFQRFEQEYAEEHRYPELGIEDDYTLSWHSNAMYNYWRQRMAG